MLHEAFQLTLLPDLRTQSWKDPSHHDLTCMLHSPEYGVLIPLHISCRPYRIHKSVWKHTHLYQMVSGLYPGWIR